MPAQRSAFTSPVDGLELATYEWDVADPRGVVQVAHGLAEHSARYDRFARALNDAGYTVRASDHRGHGDSITGTPGDFGAPGFEALIADMAAYGASLRGEPPLFLFAHSMGSFAAQSVIVTHSEQYAGVVLSGSTALDLLAAGMAEAEGPVGLEAFNAGFDHRTGYEWLSRDETEVDRYVADPLCGFDLPDETVPALFGAAGTLADPTALAGIRSGLPLLVVNAVVRENERKMEQDMKNDAAEMLEAAGFKNVTVKSDSYNMGNSIHESGTARMGNDPKKSVLNRFNQVHACKNVYVTDGSFMPSFGCQNPSLTYMAFTARAADHAVSELKKGNL